MPSHLLSIDLKLRKYLKIRKTFLKCLIKGEDMKREEMAALESILNRTLLWETFIKYIDSKYYQNAIHGLEKRMITFEFENFKTFYLN
jgi:hypothetical protein